MEIKEIVYKMIAAGIAGAALALPYTLQPLNIMLSAVGFAFLRGALVAGASYFEPSTSAGVTSKGGHCCNWATSMKKYI